jgi:DNA-binding CsgD family transcriptional regulator
MSDVTPLSEREKEILQLVASGLTNREIAQNLGISPNTVKVHLSNIFAKIGVVSRTDASMYAVEHGIVEVPGIHMSPQEDQEKILHFPFQFRWAWVALLLLIGAVLTSLLFTVFKPFKTEDPIATQDIEERWQELTPMPEPRTGMAAVAYDGKIFVIAGEGPDGVSGKVFIYDIANEIWTLGQDKPTPVSNVGGVIIGEKIYVPGGKLANGQISNTLEIYDPRQDSWEICALMPKTLSSYAIADYEGGLYIFGGWDGKQVANSVLFYDPESDEWKQDNSLVFNLHNAKADTLSTGIILVGEQNEIEPTLKAIQFLPSRYINGEYPWQDISQLPIISSDISIAVINDLIYVFSIEKNKNIIDHNLIFYDSAWNSLPIELQEDNYCNPLLVSIGPQFFIFLPNVDNSITKLFQYQALYYEIYIPIIN